MDIAVEHLSDLTRKLTITLPADTVKEALDTVYKRINKEVSLKGFRRGKTPRQVLEKNFKSQAEGEVAEQLVQASYFQAVEQEKIVPVVHPEIPEQRFNEDGSFVYVAMVDVMPIFHVEGYKELEVEQAAMEVSEEEVDKELRAIQRQQAPMQTAPEDHAIGMDDVVTIDFQGFHNGELMKEVRSENHMVDVGSYRLGKDFEDKLLGLKLGDKTLYEIDFPSDYSNPVLAGKKIEFKVDVKEIKVRVKPILDDELAKDVDPDFNTLDDLKNHLRDQLLKNKQDRQQGDLDDKIMEKLLMMNVFPVPQRLVNYEIQEMLKQTEENLKRKGLSLEASGVNLKDLVEKNREIAENRVRGDFLLKKIAELEEIKLADEDLERGYQRIANQYRMTLEEVKGYFKRREELLPFMSELHNEKVLKFLRQHAKIIALSSEDQHSNEQQTQQDQPQQDQP